MSSIASISSSQVHTRTLLRQFSMTKWHCITFPMLLGTVSLRSVLLITNDENNDSNKKRQHRVASVCLEVKPVYI